MNKQKKIFITCALFSAFVLSAMYNNCSPLHEGTIELNSSSCAGELSPVYQAVLNETTCGTCHNSSVAVFPFRVSYNTFLNTFSSAPDIRDRVEGAANRVITRLDMGGAPPHFEQKAAAENVQDALDAVLIDFDNCEAASGSSE